MWCTSKRLSGKNIPRTGAFLTGKFFRSRPETITILLMHLVVSPDLSPIIRAKNDAFARISTRKVTHHPTRTRDNSRGLSSDTSRRFSIDGWIGLSRDKSREISITTLHYTSINMLSAHSTATPTARPRPKGGGLDLYHRVKIQKRTDIRGTFLTGRIFRSRTEVSSDQERKNFPPNNIQRKRCSELRCSEGLFLFLFRRIGWRLFQRPVRYPRHRSGGLYAVAAFRASTLSPFSGRVFASPAGWTPGRDAHRQLRSTPPSAGDPPSAFCTWLRRVGSPTAPVAAAVSQSGGT